MQNHTGAMCPPFSVMNRSTLSLHTRQPRCELLLVFTRMQPAAARRTYARISLLIRIPSFVGRPRRAHGWAPGCRRPRRLGQEQWYASRHLAIGWVMVLAEASSIKGNLEGDLLIQDALRRLRWPRLPLIATIARLLCREQTFENSISESSTRSCGPRFLAESGSQTRNGARWWRRRWPWDGRRCGRG